MNIRIPLVRQHDLMDCGPASLSMITGFFGNKISLHKLRELCNINKDGVSMLNIIQAAQRIGMETYSLRMSLDQLTDYFTNPCILFWNKNHFLVLESISKKNGVTKFHILDPGYGKIVLKKEEFIELWMKNERAGIALFLNPTEKFYEHKENNSVLKMLKPILPLLKPHKKKLLLLSFFVCLGSALNVILPFLTEALIDKGVNRKNLDFIYLIILAQIFVFTGVITINVLRNWFTLIIGSNLSIDIIYSYLSKVLKLPISFFDSKNSGDFNQRIQDNIKIEEFLTSDSILTIFSALMLIVYSIILLHYNILFFVLYLGLTLAAVFWSHYWLEKRKIIDYELFRVRSENQEAVYEFYNGIKEMKLNQYEDYKKNEWILLQKRLLKINIRSLKIEQLQSTGYSFLNQLKNILVTFLAAYYVVKGNITLGALLSVSYIIGQMNSPVHQLLTFFRSQQDALLSFNRLSEVYSQPEEESNRSEKLSHDDNPVIISLKNISFRYNSVSNNYILKDLNFNIPAGKTTAIVGHSGSGKTTLMKLLLNFFPASTGSINYGINNINNISPESIRKFSGVVMQDGYIFNDTIERNIVLNDSNINKNKFHEALKSVNLYDYVNTLALKERTKIGSGGKGLSGGQKQRILIARAIYKSPKYIFLDEATSSLDTINEMHIHNNLQKLFINKTVVIIAHRLSTVQNADQIIVLSKGKVVETGIHSELINNKKHYYNLIKNQLNI